MTQTKLPLSMLLAAAACALFAVPAFAQTASGTDPLALCTQARAEALRGAIAVMFDETKKAMMRDAAARECWKLPAEDVEKQCKEASAKHNRYGEAAPASELEAGISKCRKTIEDCYRQNIELAAGLQSEATSMRSCIETAVMTGEMGARSQADAQRRDNPDGDWVRLSAREVAAVESAITKAFGGASPFPENIMRAADPRFLTFQTGRLIGEDHLAAIRKLSHPKSHYFMKQRSESVIHQVNDSRSWDVTFFIDQSQKTRLIIPIGYLPRPYSTISAYVITGHGEQSVPMELVAGHKDLFTMADPGEFQQILFHGEAKLTSENQLYLLRGTPELNDRLKFFDALRGALPRG